MLNASESEVAHLLGLDLAGLRARWRVFNGRAAPGHLPRRLLLRILTYLVQARSFGDLSPESARYLQRLASGHETTPAPVSVSAGAVLVREWAGVRHHVMAVEGGYAWNGSTYRSMSEVARAITGTKWSEPRFFGLQSKNGSAKSRTA